MRSSQAIAQGWMQGLNIYRQHQIGKRDASVDELRRRREQDRYDRRDQKQDKWRAEDVAHRTNRLEFDQKNKTDRLRFDILKFSSDDAKRKQQVVVKGMEKVNDDARKDLADLQKADNVVAPEYDSSGASFRLGTKKLTAQLEEGLAAVNQKSATEYQGYGQTIDKAQAGMAKLSADINARITGISEGVDGDSVAGELKANRTGKGKAGVSKDRKETANDAYNSDIPHYQPETTSADSSKKKEPTDADFRASIAAKYFNGDTTKVTKEDVEEAKTKWMKTNGK